MIDKLIKAARRVAASAQTYPQVNEGRPGRGLVDVETKAFAELVAATDEYFHAGRSPSRCRWCQAPLVWATTEAGKKAPLDAVPIEGLDANGTHRRIYLSHFSTCPHVDKVRAAKQDAIDTEDGKTRSAQ